MLKLVDRLVSEASVRKNVRVRVPLGAQVRNLQEISRWEKNSIVIVMKEFLLNVLIIVYASVSAIGIIAYWPTIKDLYRKKPSANINSYILWTVGSGIGFLYSLFILSDLLLKIVSGLYFGANALVLLLSIKLRHR